MRIVVLTGGLSTERDVSLATGSMVNEALRRKGHQTMLLDVFMGCGRVITRKNCLPQEAKPACR